MSMMISQKANEEHYKLTKILESNHENLPKPPIVILLVFSDVELVLSVVSTGPWRNDI